jgi:acyl dehydratase
VRTFAARGATIVIGAASEALFRRALAAPSSLEPDELTQAARAVLERRGQPRMVLGEVKALRYGSFVRPGESLKVEVTLEKTRDDGCVVFKAQGTVIRGAGTGSEAAETAVAGRLILRPLRN